MRILSVLLLLAIVGNASASDPPPTLSVVKIENGNFVQETIRSVPQAQEVAVTELVNGKQITLKKTVVVQVPVKEKIAFSTQGVRATQGGKPLLPKALEELLAEETAVVMCQGSLPEKYKKLFKDDAIILEFPTPSPPKVK